MAPSFRDLIDFLLAEIALCGDQGASPSDILAFVDEFYTHRAKDASNRCHVVDRRFQEKVWQWLTKNPEVSVGRNREGNHLKLADIEQRRLDAKDAKGEASNAHQAEPENSPARVFVSKERTWLAVTGHEPDEAKVLPMEFALLSIIASRKSAGIVQTELVRLSGQDKRSVPKRTDVLQQKGYIEKRAIQIKSARTSLCTLRRFLKTETRSNETPTEQESDTTNDKMKMIDFKQFTDKLFEILREYKLISRNDLKQLLGFSDQWRWRILSRALRKFERIGVVKRVRALSQYAATMKKFHPCIMLIRDPTEKDIEMFFEFSKNIYTNLEQSGNAEFDEDLEADDVAREPSDEAVGEVKEGEPVEESGRILPVWTPDRNVHNQIFDVVDSTGVTGTTNIDAIRAFFGGFYRRPLENTLVRLVECWQLSQPPYLRHLAIVRDTALQRTITHYVHYSARNFSKLVETGEATWEAVEFVPKNPKLDNTRVPPVDAKPHLDEYGLPLDAPKKELLKDGDTSLLDCMLVVKPPDYLRSSSDPVAVKQEDGTFEVRHGHRKLPAGTSEHYKPSESNKGRLKGTPKNLKTEYEDISDVDMEDGNIPTNKRLKRSKWDSENFQGMSEIEKLKAMGLDETWTEYSILLIDRPNPGVYVTSKGRRRPAGKRQGRPRISRLAVFKSPRLSTFSWFTRAQDQTSEVVSLSEPPQQHNREEPPISNGDTNGTPKTRNHLKSPATRGTKRSYQRHTSEGGPDSGLEVATKLRRINTKPGQNASVELITEARTAGETPERNGHNNNEQVSRKGVKKRRTQSAKISARVMDYENGLGNPPTGEEVSHDSTPNVTANMETPSKRPRRNDQTPLGKNAMSSREENSIYAALPLPDASANVKELKENAPLSMGRTRSPQSASEQNDGPLSENQPTTRIPHAGKGSQTIREAVAEILDESTSANVQIAAPLTSETPRPEDAVSNITQTPEGLTPKVRQSKTNKGGSVSFLRKSIVVDVLERAGGAYPMGTEIWYPFMTAWMKTKYKEKPDLRTIKRTIKQMVDAGKLRQQTFCGRDRKGVMVTKHIICKSDLQPDDPIIKCLQEEMLNCETRYYFPPNVEIDPELSKSGNKATTGREYKTAPQIPVESGLTVQLHQKPASVLAIEKRRGQSIQRRLLQRIDMERTAAQKQRASGVVRLLSLQRGDPGDRLIHSMTSISRPDSLDNNEKKRGPRKRRADGQGPAGGPRRLKKPWKPISSMAPYAMLMNPKQVFNIGTGTFSTDAGLAALSVPRYSIQKQPAQKLGPRLPSSLDDLFSQTRRRTLKETPDWRSKRFNRDNNAILRWELQHEELLQQKTDGLQYINQTIPDTFITAPVNGVVRFDDGWSVTCPPSPSMTTRQRSHRSPSPDDSSSSRSLSPDTTGLDSFYINVTDEYRQATALPQYRRLEKLNELMGGNDFGPEGQMSGPRQLIRRNRLAQPLSRSMLQKMMTTIVVVRTLAGGLDGRLVDWALVTSCFPEYDPKFIQDKGKGILNKHRLQLSKMQIDFQERFIEAYATGKVPSINYDELEGYDWNAVIEWANTQLDVPKSEKVPDLPATREQFDCVFELREEAPISPDDIYQGSQSVTMNRKRTIFASIPFSVPLQSKSVRNPARLAELSRVEAAKTWIRANVVAPEETYRPAEARDALGCFGNNILRSALQSLVTDRVISQGNRGRVTPGRNYDITDHFLYVLSKKRVIEGTELLRASRFKTNTLDSALSNEGVLDIAYGAEDGDILAIINLFAEGRITLHFRDVPRDKFGLTDGGYLTRQMNKDKLRFPIEVRPVKGMYVNEDPIKEKTSTIPPPCPPPQATMANPMISVPEKIPLWYDIHGQFVKVLWDLAAAAVVGCVATRPGITAEGVSSMVKPTLGAWEIRLLLQWMTEVGIMHQQGLDASGEPGWTVREWWWMILA